MKNQSNNEITRWDTGYVYGYNNQQTYGTLGVGGTGGKGSTVGGVNLAGQPPTVVDTGESGVRVTAIGGNLISLDVTASSLLGLDCGSLHQVVRRAGNLVHTITGGSRGTSVESAIQTVSEKIIKFSNLQLQYSRCNMS